jgi:diadenylate cyclase
VREIIEQFTWWSALDVLIIAVIVYQGLKLLKGTRAAQMLTGILLLVALGLTARFLLPLTTLHWLLSKLYPSILLILIIIFQDDIRHILSTMGRRPLILGNDAASSHFVVDDICRAAASLASKRIGALIVFERNILLSRYIEVGINLDARVSKELLLAIFHPTSPVHDGAVVIQTGRIASAGCFLPLTRDEYIDPNLGTRHRAAIGISQETDAVVIIVSEEGASMSVVEKGKMTRMPDAKALREELLRTLLPEPSDEDKAFDARQNGVGSAIGTVKKWMRHVSGGRF